MFKYLVLGAGKQGLATIYDLVKYCEAELVYVYEPYNRHGAEKRIGSILGEDASCVKFVDSYIKVVPDIDIIISCAPHTANLKITKVALDNKKHMVDLGGNPEVVKQQEEMTKQHETSMIVPECGISPGISNMLAAHLARRGYKDIEVRCGGIPMTRNNNPLNYKMVFSAEGVASEYTGMVPSIVNSELVMVPARGVIEKFNRQLEASPTSNNAPQEVMTLLKLGVENYNYMTLRWKGHWDAIKSMMMFWNEEQLIDHLNNCEALRYNPETDRDRLILSVKGEKKDKMNSSTSYLIEVVADPITKLSAMELCTSWGATIVAHYMVKCCKGKVGFYTPEIFVDMDWTIDQLNRRLNDFNDQ